jgi:hypothetical protein
MSDRSNFKKFIIHILSIDLVILNKKKKKKTKKKRRNTILKQVSFNMENEKVL